MKPRHLVLSDDFLSDTYLKLRHVRPIHYIENGTRHCNVM